MVAPRLVTALGLVFFALAIAAEEPQTVRVMIERQIPDEARPADMPAHEERSIPLHVTGCDGIARLQSLASTLSIVTKDQAVVIYLTAEATLEKLAKGPLAPPAVVITQKTQEGMKPATLVFEAAMASRSWENGGTFRTALRDGREVVDAKFWQSAELRCSGAPPWRPAVIPPEVTYKAGPDATLIAAAARLDAALRGPKRFGAPELYGTDPMFLIGPGLHAAIGKDPGLAEVQSPKTMTIDPVTKQSRQMLRIKGLEEVSLFAAVLHRYLGDAPPRIRAATSAELSAHWLNIGWDIAEPLLVADYGTHRLIVDYDEGGDGVMMIDELPPPPSVMAK